MGSENKYFDADFDAFVQALLEKHHVPGMSIGVVDEGKVFTKVSLDREANKDVDLSKSRRFTELLHRGNGAYAHLLDRHMVLPVSRTCLRLMRHCTSLGARQKQWLLRLWAV